MKKHCYYHTRHFDNENRLRIVITSPFGKRFLVLTVFFILCFLNHSDSALIKSNTPSSMLFSSKNSVRKIPSLTHYQSLHYLGSLNQKKNPALNTQRWGRIELNKIPSFCFIVPSFSSTKSFFVSESKKNRGQREDTQKRRVVQQTDVEKQRNIEILISAEQNEVSQKITEKKLVCQMPSFRNATSMDIDVISHRQLNYNHKMKPVGVSASPCSHDYPQAFVFHPITKVITNSQKVQSKRKSQQHSDGQSHKEDQEQHDESWESQERDQKQADESSGDYATSSSTPKSDVETMKYKLNSGLFRLTCPLLVQAIDIYEAEGAITKFNELLCADPSLQEAYRKINARHAATRRALVDKKMLEKVMTTANMEEEVLERILNSGVAGVTPTLLNDVKCLHAHTADQLCTGENIFGAMVLKELAQRRKININGKCENCWQQCNPSFQRTEDSWYYTPVKNHQKLRSRNERRTLKKKELLAKAAQKGDGC